MVAKNYLDYIVNEIHLTIAACPQNCIMTDSIPYVIEQEHCLHCGNCMTKCPVGAVERRAHDVQWTSALRGPERSVDQYE